MVTTVNGCDQLMSNQAIDKLLLTGSHACASMVTCGDTVDDNSSLQVTYTCLFSVYARGLHCSAFTTLFCLGVACLEPSKRVKLPAGPD
jgi:hypothetical protein